MTFGDDETTAVSNVIHTADHQLTYGAEAAAMLAHDINNSLAIALSNVQYISEAPDLSDDHRDAIDDTVRSLARMSALVANFVDIARFEDSSMRPQFMLSHVSPVIQDVMSVSASIMPREADIRIVCAPDLEACMDAALVKRVLHNLLGNAARYCPAGGTIAIGAAAWNAPGSLELSVANSGPNIPATLRDQLFSKSRKDSAGKRGMGLYFCRLVAEAHGGTIHMEKGPTGPTFFLRIPGAESRSP